MKKLIFLGIAALLCVSTLSAQSSLSYILLNPDQLRKNKAAIAANDPQMTEAYKALITAADRELTRGPYSVTFKKGIPPSGDKHDYMSVGPYWWPDPSKPDGLPYIRRDGEINPERDTYPDREHLGSVMNAVSTLGTAYYFSGDKKYAEYATKLLRVFFMDPETRMNPNLRFGQAVPGINDGRGIGIIETAGLDRMMEGITLISGSEAWTAQDDKTMKAWLGDYKTWLQTHPFGIAERDWHNNHGTYYDVQILSIMLFLGNEDEAREHIKKYSLNRLVTQVQPDGSQPHELERTKAWGYSTGNLNGFMKIANMADKLGIDMWHYQQNGQIYMKSMIDWFMPYLRDGKQWDYEQIAPDRVNVLVPILKIAAKKYNDPAYEAVTHQLKSIHPNITYTPETQNRGYRLLTDPGL